MVSGDATSLKLFSVMLTASRDKYTHVWEIITVVLSQKDFLGESGPATIIVQ